MPQTIATLGDSILTQNSAKKPTRQSLLQKRKSYAESVRSKNKNSTKDQKCKSKNHPTNQTLNLSLHFTTFNQTSQSASRVSLNDNLNQVQNEYFSLKKQDPTKVFKESNLNQNSLTIDIDKLDKTGISPKQSSKINNNTLVHLTQSQKNGNHSSRKNSNKENKPEVALSARKNTAQKYTSYAEIFDKKTTIHALINGQKPRSGNFTTNSISRQVSSLRNQKSGLRLVATPDVGAYDFESLGMSTNLDTFVNGFQLGEFNDNTDQISQIDFKANNSKQISNPAQNLIPETKNAINSKKLSINSQIVSWTVDMSEEYERLRKEEEREIMTLAKQNATFKRQLASFRKENSTLKKQLDNCKNSIKELEQKAETLIQHQTNLNFSLPSEAKLSQPSLDSKHHSLLVETCIPKSQSNLEQILESAEKQLFSLKSVNKALELKVYMLEKKLLHEEEHSKKKIALEVNSWREKYNKLRNEHLKLKNSMQKSYLHRDTSFSMEFSMDISGDE